MIGDHRDGARPGADGGSLRGAGEPAPAFFVLDRTAAPLGFAAGRARQRGGMDEAQDGAVVRVHGHDRMKVEPAAPLRLDHRRILDGQHVATRTAWRRGRSRRGDHLVHHHGPIAQQPRELDFAGPVAPQAADADPVTTRLDEPGEQEDPLFPGGGRQTAPASSRPSPPPGASGCNRIGPQSARQIRPSSPQARNTPINTEMCKYGSHKGEGDRP